MVIRACASASTSLCRPVANAAASESLAANSSCSAAAATRHAPTPRADPLSVCARAATRSGESLRTWPSSISACRSNNARTSDCSCCSPRVMRAKCPRSMPPASADWTPSGRSCASPVSASETVSRAGPVCDREGLRMVGSESLSSIGAVPEGFDGIDGASPRTTKAGLTFNKGELRKTSGWDGLRARGQVRNLANEGLDCGRIRFPQGSCGFTR